MRFVGLLHSVLGEVRLAWVFQLLRCWLVQAADAVKKHRVALQLFAVSHQNSSFFDMLERHSFANLSQLPPLELVHLL